MFVEAYTTVNYTMMYYSTETHRAHMPFNFNCITQLNITSTAIDIKNAIYLWMDNMPINQWPNWVVCIDKFDIVVLLVIWYFYRK